MTKVLVVAFGNLVIIFSVIICICFALDFRGLVIPSPTALQLRATISEQFTRCLIEQKQSSTYDRPVLFTYDRSVLVTYDRPVVVTYDRSVLVTYDRSVFVTYNRPVLVTYDRSVFGRRAAGCPSVSTVYKPYLSFDSSMSLSFTVQKKTPNH